MTPTPVNLYDTYHSLIGRPNQFGIADLVGLFVTNTLYISTLIVLILLVGGGIAFISGAGSDDPQKAAKGKNAITYAIIGFVIIFTSYWIIQAVELITGLSILDPAELTP